MRSLTPAADAHAADWVVAGLRDFGEGSVLSVVPAGFDAYVRLFHPAYRGRHPDLEPVRWAEIAEARGARVHPGMQMDAISGRDETRGERPPEGIDHWPELGSLPRPIAAELAAILREHTAAPERCWFAVWDGYPDAYRDDMIKRCPIVRAPGRWYFLLEGPIDAVDAGVVEPPGGYQSPNLWWPDDRAWCVATEIDFNTTYVGCNVATGAELPRISACEVMAIDPATGVDCASDGLNPLP